MCTYVTENVGVSGSAKGVAGWSPVTRATVYFDHPFHAPFEHSLNVDFAGPANEHSTTSARHVAVELSADSARALAHAILATLDSGEASIAGVALTELAGSGGGEGDRLVHPGVVQQGEQGGVDDGAVWQGGQVVAGL
jgi:hypothetical protein